VKPYWLGLAIALTACSGGSVAAPAAQQAGSAAPAAAAQPSAPASRAIYVAHRPPSAKDVIDAAIASAAIPLTVSPTCSGVGTEPSDATIGRYLAGFLAELSNPAKKNWIETRIAPGKSTAGEGVSICSVTVRHEDGDDRWGWGIQFQVRASDGLVLPDSFTCLGAG
jgi:hypothetical protein